MRTPPPRNRINVTPAQAELDRDAPIIAAHKVGSEIFCACATCCKCGGTIHAGKFTCPWPEDDKPTCSIPVIAADVIVVLGGGTADLTKYSRDFVQSMIQSEDLIPRKSSAKVAAVTVEPVTQ